MEASSRATILALWSVFFLGGVWTLYGLGGFHSLGFTALLGGAGDVGRLWASIFRTIGIVGLLTGIGWAVHRFAGFRTKVPFADFLIVLWPSLCGVQLSLQRWLHASPGADTLAILEPALVSVLFPLLVGSVGRLVLWRLSRIRPMSVESCEGMLKRFLLAQMVGAPALAVVLFIMALSGFWKPVHLWMLSAILLAAGGFHPRRRTTATIRTEETTDPGDGEGETRVRRIVPAVGAWGLLLVLLFGVFQLSWLPPDDSDELRYHLTFPKRYLEAGEFTAIPDQLFSYFPTGMEMLMGLPISLDWLRSEESRWGLVSGGKFVHAWSAWLCVILLVMWGRELRPDDRKREGAWPPDSLPAVLFLSIPFVPVLASWAFVDFGSAFGWLASGYLGWRFFIRPEGADSPSILPHLVGWALGWALMVKYTGLAWCLLFGIAWLVFSIVGRRSLAAFVPVVVVPTLLFIPWLVNNALQTGNPVAPMLPGIFGSGFDPVQKAFYEWHAGMKGDLNSFRELGLGRKVLDLARLPFRAALEPGKFENNPIGGLMLLFLPCFFFGLRKQPKGRGTGWIAILTLGCFLLWGLTYRDPRFAVPLWAFSLLIVHAGIFALHPSPAEARGSWVRGLVLGCVLFLGLSQSEEVFRRLSGFGPVVRLEVDPDDYLFKRLPAMKANREVERLRRQEASRPNLLLLGQEQSYYFDSPLRGTDYFDGPLLARFAREATGVVQISQRLISEGVGWIFVNRETLELHPANRVRGWWFSLEPEAGAEAIEEVRRTGNMGAGFEQAGGTPAFRRMHAWLATHPGYRERPLLSSPNRERELAELYRPCLAWPEMQGLAVENLPKSGYSLLVRE